MSHVVEIEPETADQAISSLIAADLAARRMGGKLIRDKKTYSWYGEHVGDYALPAGRKPQDLGNCEHAISFDKAKYEVGLVEGQKFPGTYSLQYDFYDPELKSIMGTKGSRFMQLYQTELAKAQAQSIDGNCVETEDEEGNIYIEIDTTQRLGY